MPFFNQRIRCFIGLSLSLSYALLRLTFSQAVFEKRLKETAMAVPLMCCGADMLAVPSRKQVVVVGHKSSPEFDSMLAAAHASYDPNRTVSPPSYVPLNLLSSR